MAVDEKVETLRQMYAAIAEAIIALRDHDKQKDHIERLKKTVESQKRKISDLITIQKALEQLSGHSVVICSRCLGAGAYQVGDEVEECSQCDGVGALVK